jgi:hypothetical protein
MGGSYPNWNWPIEQRIAIGKQISEAPILHVKDNHLALTKFEAIDVVHVVIRQVNAVRC